MTGSDDSELHASKSFSLSSSVQMNVHIESVRKIAAGRPVWVIYGS